MYMSFVRKGAIPQAVVVPASYADEVALHETQRAALIAAYEKRCAERQKTTNDTLVAAAEILGVGGVEELILAAQIVRFAKAAKPADPRVLLADLLTTGFSDGADGGVGRESDGQEERRSAAPIPPANGNSTRHQLACDLDEIQSSGDYDSIYTTLRKIVLKISSQISDNIVIMMRNDILEAAAEILGLDGSEELRLAAEVLRTATAASRTSHHTPEEAKAARNEALLADRLLHYRVRLKVIDLPERGFTDEEQFAAAGRLSQSYRQLKKLQIELGFPVAAKDPRVKEAERLRWHFEKDGATLALPACN
jgi:hypothetical protein